VFPDDLCKASVNRWSGIADEPLDATTEGLSVLIDTVHDARRIQAMGGAAARRVVDTLAVDDLHPGQGSDRISGLGARLVPDRQLELVRHRGD